MGQGLTDLGYEEREGRGAQAGNESGI